MSDADPTAEAAATDTQRDVERRRSLRTMQRLALLLLLAMAALWGAARLLEGHHAAWGYIAAFAEAAMIGALADWFAVVALFRHPLGLPIWHTAIVPRRKDDIARNLGQFVESHFVTEEAVLGHVRRFDPAGRAAGWLASHAHSPLLAQGIAQTLHRVLQRFDDTRLRDLLQQRLVSSLAQVDPMPFAATWAEALMREGRHQQALDWSLQHAVDWLESDAAQPSIAQVLDTVDHVLVSALSGRIAAIVRSGALRLCKGAQADPVHVLRQRWDAVVARGVQRLHDDPDWALRVHGFQQELLASEPLRARLQALWTELKQALLDDLQQPSSRAGLAMSRLLADLGTALAADEAARAWLNDLLCKAAAPVIARNRGQVAAYIQRQIDAWSQDEMTDRIELAIGRDLQFIRLNGTVVGGLVGVLLHAVMRFLPG